MRPFSLAAVLSLSLALGGAAAAQAPAPMAKAPAAKTTSTTATTKTATPDKPRTAASLQCSKDADAKNIHGKPRKAFMSSCKKAAAKS